jgi:DNA replication and repair protein RecF
VLSLKLGCREIFYQDSGEYPVLLLDDVLSELDARRQEFVLSRITGGQVFITCCEEDRLTGLDRGQTFHIQNGTLL